jgi:hypothetical protein
VVPEDRNCPPQSLEELRRMLTPEMREELRRAAPAVRRAMEAGFPDRIVAPRSFCLGFAADWGLPDDPDTISGLVHLLLEEAAERPCP